MTDEPQFEEVVEPEPEVKAPKKVVYVEFLGMPPYGTEFTSSHGIDAEHMREYHDVDLGIEEVKWTRGKNGRFLVPADQMTSEAVEVLDNDPMFQVVEL